jgi:hypothetical protein
MIPRVSCNHRSERPPPNSSTAETNAGRDAEPPPLEDPRKHHRQRCFVSRWAGLLHAARHMPLWHIDRGTSPYYLGPRYVASHRQSSRRTTNPPPPDQHSCSRRTTLPRPHAPSRITTDASDTPRNWFRQIWRLARRPSREGPASTCCHQLRGASLKVVVDVGVELMQIYLPRRRSHHPNDVPRKTKPNPNY